MRHCDGLEDARVVPLRVANNCRYKNHYKHRQLNRYILVDFIRQKPLGFAFEYQIHFLLTFRR